MSDFKVKMHQIRFRLGLRPTPRWGSLQRSPDPLAGFKGPTYNTIQYNAVLSYTPYVAYSQTIRRREKNIYVAKE